MTWRIILASAETAGAAVLNIVDGQGTNAETSAKLNVLVPFFRSTYTALRRGGIVLFAISLVCAFIRYAVAKDGSRGREMTKDWVVRVCIGSMAVGAAAFIVGTLVAIGREF